MLWLTLRKLKQRIVKKSVCSAYTIIIWSDEFNLGEWTDKMNWYMPNRIKQILWHKNKCKNINDRYNIHLVAEKKYLYHPIILRKIHNAFIVDPDFYDITEVIHLCSIFGHCEPIEKQNRLRELSKNNYSRLKESLANRTKSILYGTGPSVSGWESITSATHDGNINIICNSIIKNDRFMNTISPDILCIADPLFHFGYNDYALTFRSQLINRFIIKPFFIVLPNYHAGLFLHHFPQTSDYIIAVSPSTYHNIPDQENLVAKGTDNILTFLMLPMAASLSNDIFLIGFDGRNPTRNETFWAHHDEFQFVQEKSALKKYHSSFFRDRNYSTYANNHSKLIQSLIDYIRSKKKIKIHLLNYSFIPALQKYYTNSN